MVKYIRKFHCGVFYEKNREFTENGSQKGRSEDKVERIGIIDLGSNTARLVIVDLFAEGHFMVTDQLKESVRLGQDMDRDGFLKPPRAENVQAALRRVGGEPHHRGGYGGGAQGEKPAFVSR